MLLLLPCGLRSWAFVQSEQSEKVNVNIKQSSESVTVFVSNNDQRRISESFYLTCNIEVHQISDYRLSVLVSGLSRLNVRPAADQQTRIEKKKFELT